MTSRARAITVNALKFAVPAVILGWLLSRIEPDQWDALKTQPKNYALLASALLLASVAVFLSFVRWAVLVRSQGIALGYLAAFRLGAIGFFLSFVSAGSVGGDLFKAIFLARKTPGLRLEAVASVVVDRAMGLYGLLLVVISAMVLFPPATVSEDFHRLSLGAGVLAVAGTIAIAVVVLGGRWIDRLLRRVDANRWFGKIIHRVADPLRMFHTHPWQLLISAVLSVGVHLLLSISMYLIARGLYSAPPTFTEHLIIVPVGMLAAALPLTPAGLGVLEATIAWLYQLVPPVPTAASGTLVALTFEIVKLILAAAGIVFYWTSQAEVDAIRQLDAAPTLDLTEPDLTDKPLVQVAPAGEAGSAADPKAN